MNLPLLLPRIIKQTKTLGKAEPVRVVATLLALHALPKDKVREEFVTEAVEALMVLGCDVQAQ